MRGLTWKTIDLEDVDVENGIVDLELDFEELEEYAKAIEEGFEVV